MGNPTPTSFAAVTQMKTNVFTTAFRRGSKSCTAFSGDLA